LQFLDLLTKKRKNSIKKLTEINCSSKTSNFIKRWK
jgi:hypothetical protein